MDLHDCLGLGEVVNMGRQLGAVFQTCIVTYTNIFSAHTQKYLKLRYQNRKESRLLQSLSTTICHVLNRTMATKLSHRRQRRNSCGQILHFPGSLIRSKPPRSGSPHYCHQASKPEKIIQMAEQNDGTKDQLDQSQLNFQARITLKTLSPTHRLDHIASSP